MCVSDVQITFEKNISIRTESFLWENISPEILYGQQTESLTLQASDGENYYYGNEIFLLKLQVKRTDAVELHAELSCKEGARRIERIHLLSGQVPTDLKICSLLPVNGSKRFISFGESVVAQQRYIEELFDGFQATWLRNNDRLHSAENVAMLRDFAFLFQDENGRGLSIGCFKGKRFEGEIAYNTENARVCVGFAAENVEFSQTPTDLGAFFLKECTLNAGAALWASKCAEAIGLTYERKQFVGYCSWYHDAMRIKPETMIQASKQFKELALPQKTVIQLDDGFQNCCGDWDGRESDGWAEMLTKLPKIFEENGQIPGIWLAPTMISLDHPLVKEHPEIVQRLPDGTPAIRFSNWDWCAISTGKRSTGALELDHPLAKEFMRELLLQKKKDGWKYFKIDFTYCIAPVREKYDKNKTEFETLCDLWTLIRETLGDDVYINACIGGNYRWALGKADVARIGGDVFPDIEHAAASMQELALANCTNHKWWLADPDVYYMSQSHTRGTAHTNLLLTGTFGLFNGLYMTSDLPEWWTEEERRIVKNLCPLNEPIVGSRTVLDEQGTPCVYIAEYEDRIRYAFYRLGGELTPAVLERCGLAADEILTDLISGDGVQAGKVFSYRQDGETLIVLFEKEKKPNACKG